MKLRLNTIHENVIVRLLRSGKGVLPGDPLA